MLRVTSYCNHKCITQLSGWQKKLIKKNPQGD